MNTTYRTKFFVIAVLILVLSLAGCTAPSGRASVSDAYIQTLADEKLKAINEGDYETFLKDLSNPMLEAFTESSFSDFRVLMLESSGQYESITRSTVAKAGSPEFVAYVYTCKFEKENVVLSMIYKIDGDLVEGLFVDSTNLRKAASPK